jgi:hypothetical protein
MAWTAASDELLSAAALRHAFVWHDVAVELRYVEREGAWVELTAAASLASFSECSVVLKRLVRWLAAVSGGERVQRGRDRCPQRSSVSRTVCGVGSDVEQGF